MTEGEEFPQVSDAATGENEQVGAAATGEDDVCALEECDLPLPARALDALGRPKGGRRPRYCSKAHADAASRQRRARDSAAVADPLAQALTAGKAFVPAARELA